jgi:hypothetical protein
MHAGGLDDQPVPGAIELPGEVESFDRSMLLSAMLVTNNRLVPVARRLGPGKMLNAAQEVPLVAFDLRQDRVAARLGGLKGFFDSGGRRP